MSFAISFGLVIGFGIPTSIGASIILIHCLLLTTDIIGTWCPDTKVGTILSGVIGAVYGLLILVGLEAIVTLFGYLPFNFLNNLGSVSTYVTVAFAVFPALAVAYQHGFKKGTITAAVTVVFYFILKYFNTANLIPSTFSVSTSFLAAYLTFRRSPYFALAYASNDIVLIILWVLASLNDISYISVVICFAVFLVNDLYGFISWLKMMKRQEKAIKNLLQY